MQLLLLQNQLKNESGFHFIDSTPVSTCLNRRIFSHKVTKKIASHGKSTKGCFEVINKTALNNYIILYNIILYNII